MSRKSDLIVQIQMNLNVLGLSADEAIESTWGHGRKTIAQLEELCRESHKVRKAYERGEQWAVSTAIALRHAAKAAS